MNGQSRAEFVVDVDTVKLCWGENLTETYHRVSHPIRSTWGGEAFESWQYDGYAVRKHTGQIMAYLPNPRGQRSLGCFKTLEDGAEAVIDFTRARLETGARKLELLNAQHRI